MVKREDAINTTQGRVRDTDQNTIQSAYERDEEDAANPQPGCYKPEMGTIIIHKYPGPHGES